MLQIFVKLLELFKQYPSTEGFGIRKTNPEKNGGKIGGEEGAGIKIKFPRQQDE